MPRINLSIDEELFANIEKDAVKKSTTVNLLIIDLLGGLYGNESFNYSEALKQLIIEAENYAKNPKNDPEFTLVKLSSFVDICIAKAVKAKIQPSIVRARLGKMFNAKVRHGEVTGVSRAKDKNGTLKFIEKTAVYAVDYSGMADEGKESE